MFSSGVVAVSGSRSLSAGQAAQVREVVRGLAASGCRFVVGCATGADETALACMPPSVCHVFAAFGPGGAGACRWSAVESVSHICEAGGSVSWWAGGGPSVPLHARLAARTAAVAAAGSTGLVAFFASPSSRGTALACRLASARGVPVVAFPLGFTGAALPSLGAGCWLPCNGAGVWASAYVWAVAQGVLL